MPDRPKYDSAIFWVALGGAVCAIGGILMGVGVAQVQPDPKASLLANPLFLGGLVGLLAGIVMLVWALMLFLAHGPADTPVTAEPTPSSESGHGRALVNLSEVSAAPPEVPPLRTPCRLSPAELVRLFGRGSTHLQSQTLVEPYRGQWRKVSGLVKEVTWHNEYVIGITATDPEEVALTLFFAPAQWADQLRGLMPGDWLEALGMIDIVSKGSVLFKNCEVLD